MKPTKVFETTSGKFLPLREAQIEEIACIISGPKIPTEDHVHSAQAIVEAKDHVLDILTTTETSIPKARKINGGTKKRTPKSAPELPISTTEAA